MFESRPLAPLDGPLWVDWEQMIARADEGPHADDKLAYAASLLTAAIQRSRLRGDRASVDSLNSYLARVHELLDAH